MKNISFSIPNITNEDVKIVGKILKSGWLTHGKYTVLFEEKFKESVGGIDPGAPINPKIGRKFLITTIITSIIFIVIYYLVQFDLLNLREYLK